MSLLVKLTQDLPIGTNLALLQFMWMLVSGALLPQRGAIFPALQATGLSVQATRRSWAAFRGGVWRTAVILKVWQDHIQGQTGWKATRYEGYRAVLVDTTGFWRPALKNCPSKHYNPIAQRALPAILFGIAGEVGTIGGRRLACPRAFERVNPTDPSEERLWCDMLRHINKTLAEDEIMVADAGIKVNDLQIAGVKFYVLRLAGNFTCRRNELPVYSGRGRKATYGVRIRPLERSYKGKKIAKTTPDRTETWTEDGIEMRAEIWENVVLPDVVPDKDAKTFHVYAIYDPAYETPWLLATTLKLKAETIKAIYHDRWAIEQIPLAAKQMVGAHRQFVHTDESVQRLPELALLAGSILSFLAAMAPLAPTGFWDRQPKRTPGRFRRCLMGKPFPQTYLLPSQFRKKESFTGHFLKGILARRPKADAPAPVAAP